MNTPKTPSRRISHVLYQDEELVLEKLVAKIGLRTRSDLIRAVFYQGALALGLWPTDDEVEAFQQRKARMEAADGTDKNHG